ncbi:biotin/lipoyl-binding protein, partial [Siccirubricoccus sp. KC 17139]
MKRGALLLGLLALAGLAGFALRHPGNGAPEPAPAAATAAPVGVGALGRVEPASRIRKLNQPGGFAVARLERLLVAEGDEVAEGQLLAVFSDAAQKDAAVVQAEAAAVQSRAALARLRAAGRPEEVA